MDDTDALWQFVRKLHTTLFILLDQLYCHAISCKMFCKIVTDTATTTENDTLCFVGDNSKITQQFRQDITGRGNKQMISLTQNKVTSRNLHNTVTADRTYKDFAFHNALQIHKGNIT